ncbi:thymidine kinase 2, mitochondrial-like [Anneissia japonica]|uniref:thymidine kinase 2, mitochondrial-like n=1 Tax=Anneissia japonica TaxID=1529436 RepID=UPI001425677A|nr:thymidine kinase 2, mitochondrial-like [Anneissia japonica]
MKLPIPIRQFCRSFSGLQSQLFSSLAGRISSQTEHFSQRALGLGHHQSFNIYDKKFTLSNRLPSGLLQLLCRFRPGACHLNKQFYSTAGHNMFLIQKPIVIAIEGNIGSGKTRMLEFFEKHVPEVETLMEPVHKWRNFNGHNLLGMMYNDPERWSFTFQSYVQLTMAESHRTPQTKPVMMRERSIYSAKYCFVENLYECEKMSKAEYDVLTGWFDWILKNQTPKVDSIIYLRTTPENCQRRIKERSREEESCIPIEYLQHLHQLHEDWLINKTKFPLPAPVTVLDANLTLDQMFEMYTKDQHKILTAT